MIKMTTTDTKTCPRYYTMRPDVAAIFSELDDYERGSLGPVGRLTGRTVDAYRVALAARGEWQEAMAVEASQ